ncbi:pyridoxamine 5'-phosphate oxidase family protein [Chengkuizengella axinellae]|uniref:Pyridoxamine 5'-phosphate oxidase family protein n=1 Tax=Chengkuizengella axinellae TaxID=3064388 RepID=A0ABT9IU23_9BACL|nr:pyridoxamine 5'-phosphate oxidase family protein [Chengkuizengella sp. 2205SS18-9]MDP5272859.1 pyridoxamine 5'-phosphate oxidase family protein [Chengkuizengella sp. 2205SS18-9]
MGSFFDELNSHHIDFIQNQNMFFVGTAPSQEGEINVSPKGYDTIKILDSNSLIYLDYNGSGNETAIHINQNEKITVMWCSFEKKPLILRVYGRGVVIGKESEDFKLLLSKHFPTYDLRIVRQLFLINIKSVQSSCGWGVPFMEYVKDRNQLDDLSKAKYQV